MKFLIRMCWVLLAVALFCFALLAVNQDQVTLRFLSWQTPEVSVFWWLLAAFLLGLILGSVAVGLGSLRLRLKQRSLGRELQASRGELQKLRALTLQD